MKKKKSWVFFSLGGLGGRVFFLDKNKIWSGISKTAFKSGILKFLWYEVRLKFHSWVFSI